MDNLIYPHTEHTVEAWVRCAKCNGSLHRIMPGEITPWWFCQDEKQELKVGQEVEVEYRE